MDMDSLGQLTSGKWLSVAYALGLKASLKGSHD
jgi:hypothetical protein